MLEISKMILNEKKKTHQHANKNKQTNKENQNYRKSF